MALNFGDNIDYRGKKPLDNRLLFETIEEMASYSENYLPELAICQNEEDRKLYVYDSSNDVDDTLGKWRVFEAGGEGGCEIKDFTVEPYYADGTHHTIDNIQYYFSMPDWAENAVYRLNFSGKYSTKYNISDDRFEKKDKKFTDSTLVVARKKTGWFSQYNNLCCEYNVEPYNPPEIPLDDLGLKAGDIIHFDNGFDGVHCYNTKNLDSMFFFRNADGNPYEYKFTTADIEKLNAKKGWVLSFLNFDEQPYFYERYIYVYIERPNVYMKDAPVWGFASSDTTSLTDMLEHKNNSSIHVTQVQKNNWDKKQDAITEDHKLDYSLIDNGPSIPTKTSELENDSNFITEEDIPTIPTKVSELENDSGYITENDLPDEKTKLSEFEDDLGDSPTHTHSQYLTEHQSLDGYAKEEDIPTKVSKLENDSGYTTFDGDYNSLSNKPTIPSEVTESTVSGWGFTKNKGTYSKPSTGIPKTDLASAVQTSLGKADTALQSHQDISGKQDKVAKLGSTSKPVYVSADGTFAETKAYGGGTAVTFNGTSKAGSTASFYAPTTAGTSGQVLQSNGSGAPTWVDSTMTKAGLLDLIYPIGSIYMSEKNVSPQTFLGGTWEALTEGYALRTTTTADKGGTTTGKDTITLAKGNLPSHTHKVTEYWLSYTLGATTLSAAQSGLRVHSHRQGLNCAGPKCSANLSTTDNTSDYASCFSWNVTNWYLCPEQGNWAATSSHTHSLTAKTESASRTTDGGEGTGTAYTHTPKSILVYAWKRTG